MVASLASGLPKSYIKKYGISKKAWKEYRKSKGHSSRTKRGSTPPRRTGVRRLTRRKKRRRSPRTIPVLPLVGLAGGALEPVKRMLTGDIEGGVVELLQRSTGISTVDGSFHPEWLGSFWLPIVVGGIGHKVANWIGINRVFSRLPAPLNKLRL